MRAEYYTTVFPSDHKDMYIREEDLKSFSQSCLDYMKASTHIAQLQQGPRTIGLTTLAVYPEYKEVHITFGEIIKDMRGQGLHRQFLTSVFDFSSTLSQKLGEHIYITVASFTEAGEERSLPLLREMSEDYINQGVTFDNRF